jgi:hypothetical protein
MRHAGMLVALILVVGVVGAAVALRSREDNAQFVSQQRSLAPVAATDLERLIFTTSDPRPGYGGPRTRARDARCVSGGDSALGNPWSCVVRYPHPPDVRYRVLVRADRSIYGVGQPEGAPLRGVLTLSGCCVAGGTAP